MFWNRTMLAVIATSMLFTAAQPGLVHGQGLERILREAEQRAHEALQPSQRRGTPPPDEGVAPSRLPGESGRVNIPGRFDPGSFGGQQGTRPGPGGGGVYQEPPLRADPITNQPIVIRFSGSGTGQASYQLLAGNRSYPYTIQRGQGQTFNETRRWLIRFHNGSETVTYRLRGGRRYTFEIDERGRLLLYRESEQFDEPPLRTAGSQ